MIPDKVGIVRLIEFDKVEGVYVITFEILCDLTGDKATVTTQVSANEHTREIDAVHEAFHNIQGEIEKHVDAWLTDIKG